MHNLDIYIYIYTYYSLLVTKRIVSGWVVGWDPSFALRIKLTC